MKLGGESQANKGRDTNQGQDANLGQDVNLGQGINLGQDVNLGQDIEQPKAKAKRTREAEVEKDEVGPKRPRLRTYSREGKRGRGGAAGL